MEKELIDAYYFTSLFNHGKYIIKIDLGIKFLKEI
jgi:hypothetical protein